MPGTAEKYLIRIIAVVQIVGGVIGIWNSMVSSVSGAASFLGDLFLRISVVPFILSLVAGIFLWNGNSKGMPLSLGLQASQVPRITGSYFLYYFFSGLDLGPSLSWGAAGVEMRMDFHLGAFFRIDPDAYQGEAIIVGINVIACAFAIILLLLLIKKSRAISA